MRAGSELSGGLGLLDYDSIGNEVMKSTAFFVCEHGSDLEKEPTQTGEPQDDSWDWVDASACAEVVGDYEINEIDHAGATENDVPNIAQEGLPKRWDSRF